MTHRKLSSTHIIISNTVRWIGQTPTQWHSVSTHAHPYSHSLTPTNSMHVEYSHRHMHTLHPKTHTHRAYLPPSSTQSESLINKLRWRGAVSLLLSNGGLFTQTVGVTKQLNEGRESWPVVIKHNLSPIFFHVSLPTNGGLERERWREWKRELQVLLITLIGPWHTHAVQVIQ